MKYFQIVAFFALVAVGFVVGRGLWRPGTTVAAGMETASAPAPPSETRPQRRATAPAPRLAVAFRLDPDVTRGLYLGERWVSPPSFLFAQPGNRYVVRAKAQQIDARGERIDLSADWAASDPEMVAITRGHGEVTIVVRRPGESRLTVSTGAGSRVLHVRAEQLADAMQVEITQ